MLAVRILGTVLVAFGGYLTVARLLQESGSVTFPGGSVKVPSSLLVIALGVAVFLYPNTPWWPDSDPDEIIATNSTTTTVVPATTTTLLPQPTTTTSTPATTTTNQVEAACAFSGQVLQADALVALPNVGVFFSSVENLNQEGARPERTKPDGTFTVKCSGFAEAEYPLTLQLFGVDWCRGSWVTGETITRDEVRSDVALYVPSDQIEGSGFVCSVAVDLVTEVARFQLVDLAVLDPRYELINNWPDFNQFTPLVTATTQAP